jgi:hypothetical protein
MRNVRPRKTLIVLANAYMATIDQLSLLRQTLGWSSCRRRQESGGGGGVGGLPAKILASGIESLDRLTPAPIRDLLGSSRLPGRRDARPQ